MLKPSDIREKEFKHVGRGLDERDVNMFLEDVYVDYEILCRENTELKNRIESMDKNLEFYRNIETTLRNTMLLAEKTAEDVKCAAEKNAAQIEKEASMRAEAILRESKDRIFGLKEEISRLEKHYELMKTRIKHFLTSELELLEKNPLPMDETD